MVSAALPALRAMLMTLYATGARNAELTRLKFSDFDKQRMVVHIQGRKGGKDRDVMLSSKLLEELRGHWHRLRRRPKVWLFPGQHNHRGDRPPSIRKSFGMPATKPRSVPAFRNACIRTP